MKKFLSKKNLFFAAILVAAFIYLVLLEPIARFLIVPDTQKPSESIVVLGGGLGVQRVIHAVKLYEKGIAPIIILTGQEMEFDGRKIRFKDIKLTEPRLAGMLAKMYGVPEDILFFEERSQNTYEDAKYVKEDLLKMGIHSAIIVSDPFHMQRVSMIFRKVFKDTPVSLTFSPADDGEFLLGGLWSPGEIKYILTEYTKIAYYIIRY
ncbi:MAG TPA: YdcF family protein [Candidatus Wunengus sp. YC61]|uniref:YdcF family protein n=1 Tax=Candidatus Wunengus sp. YC61 TaxID=3367698 RepID=UPI004027F319